MRIPKEFFFQVTQISERSLQSIEWTYNLQRQELALLQHIITTKKQKQKNIKGGY